MINDGRKGFVISDLKAEASLRHSIAFGPSWPDSLKELEIRTRVGDPAGDVIVDKEYYACDCMGKVGRISLPYRSGDTISWTETQYDGLGRCPVHVRE